MRRIPGLLLLALPALLTAAPADVTFTDITEAAGISFIHNNGAFGKRYQPEMFGSGCVFFDMDNDGRQDLLLINSGRFPGQEGPASLPALYRNVGAGRFVDVTKGSGLDVELFGMGAAAGDFDNDGLVDLYVTAYGGGHLYRNLGGGTFTDFTDRSGIADKRWSTRSSSKAYAFLESSGVLPAGTELSTASLGTLPPGRRSRVRSARGAA